MSVKVLYRTQATATGGRDGKSATADGAFQVNLSTPKELGGAGGSGNNPEQLFAAGYAACFLGAMKVVASQGRPEGAGGRDSYCRCRHWSAFGRRVSVSISRWTWRCRVLTGLRRKKLVAKAHQVCPYSNATRNNVDVKLTVV